MSSGGAIELTRLCVAVDGRIKANFSDNSILLLSSSGRAFVAIQPDGQQQRHLADFALSRHVMALAVTMEFRNLHLAWPCFCAKLRTPRQGLVLGYRMSDLWWPGTAAEALKKGLVKASEDGKVALGTEDGSGQVVVHQNRRRFAVCYPLLVGEQQPEEGGTYEYLWQTQVFSLGEYPARWAPAVRLAMQVVRRLDGEAGGGGGSGGQQRGGEKGWEEDWEEGDQGEVGSHRPWGGGAATTTAATTATAAGRGGRRTELPEAVEGGYHHHCQQAAFHHHHLPYRASSDRPLEDSEAAGGAERGEDGRGGGGPSQASSDHCDTSGWWSEQTLTLLPEDVLIVLEWTPQATYQFHPSPSSGIERGGRGCGMAEEGGGGGGGGEEGGGCGEVEAWLHEDESCLATVRQGRFLAHYRPTPALPNSPADGRSQGAIDGVGVGGAGGGERVGKVTESLYAASCVPESVWSDASRRGGGASYSTSSSLAAADAVNREGGGSRYSLAPIAAHAVKLRQQMCTLRRRLTADWRCPIFSCISGGLLDPGGEGCSNPLPVLVPPPSHGGWGSNGHQYSPSSAEALGGGGRGGGGEMAGTMPLQGLLGPPGAPASLDYHFAVASEVVVEEATVPGQGEFVAYADGRLRCFFEDRTILHTDASRTYCKLLMPDGGRLMVSSLQPVGVEGYVRAALAFAAWAFKPPEERARDWHARMCAQAEINSSQRMAHMLEWAAAKGGGGGEPPAVTVSITPGRAMPPPPYLGAPASSAAAWSPPGAGPSQSLSPHSAGASPHLADSGSSHHHFSAGDVEAMLRRNRELADKLSSVPNNKS